MSVFYSQTFFTLHSFLISWGFSRAGSLLRDIRTLFESDEEDYHKLIRIGNAFSENYIEYESNGDQEKLSSIKKYLNKIRPCLSDLNDHKKQWEWKIQLTIAINFVSSKDTDEKHTMNSKGDNIEIITGNETDEIIEELFWFSFTKIWKWFRKK